MLRGISSRVAANILALVVFSAVVVVGAFLTFVSGVLFDDSYPVSVPMPQAGGVLPGQEVTVLGRAVGVVDDVTVTQNGVRIDLRIDGQYTVPEETVVQVLRRSPIGEQSVDFQPVGAGWEPAPAGATIEPVETKVPAEIPALLDATVELFAAIAPADVATVLEESADALGGRGERLKQLNRDLLDLSETLVEGIPTFERLLDTSEPVLASLQEHREALAQSFTEGADLTEILADTRPTVERLLDTAPLALTELQAFIEAERANLHCLGEDLLSLNRLLLSPTSWDGVEPRPYRIKLDELEIGLLKHEFFYETGFPLVGQPDPETGLLWLRILFHGPDKVQGGQPYGELRPTPATAPGAACETEAFGTGVDAVRQAELAPLHPTVAAIGDDLEPLPWAWGSPGIDYAPLVGGSSTASDSTASGDDRSSRASHAPRAPLPATGGGAAVLGGVVLAIGAWSRKRSS